MFEEERRRGAVGSAYRRNNGSRSQASQAESEISECRVQVKKDFTSSSGLQHIIAHISFHNGPSTATSINPPMHGMSPQLCLVCACGIDQLIFYYGAQAAD